MSEKAVTEAVQALGEVRERLEEKRKTWQEREAEDDARRAELFALQVAQTKSAIEANESVTEANKALPAHRGEIERILEAGRAKDDPPEWRELRRQQILDDHDSIMAYRKESLALMARQADALEKIATALRGDR